MSEAERGVGGWAEYEVDVGVELLLFLDEELDGRWPHRVTTWGWRACCGRSSDIFAECGSRVGFGGVNAGGREAGDPCSFTASCGRDSTGSSPALFDVVKAGA